MSVSFVLLVWIILLQLSVQPSFWSALVSLVADASFLWAVFFVVRLHGHLHTFRRFLILLTMSLPLLLFGWFLTPPHCFSGFRHSPIRKNVLLPGLLPCVQWGTMYHYYMPISCHLHGMLLSHIGVMLHNLGTFYFLRFFWFIWFNCSDAMNLSAANIVILVALLL